ncbi:MAG: CAP domain-containing protein [bacterium]
MMSLRYCIIALTLACSAFVQSKSADTSAQRADVVSTPNAIGEEIVVRTNVERKAVGVPALARNAALMNAAQLQANQMAARNIMAHQLAGAAYPSLDSRLAAVRYGARAAGENVAEGHPSSAAVVAGWMSSPGHRANIVSTHFTEMGAGAATAKNGRRFYAQVFGTPR